jgi:hypothetical protein
MYQYPIGMAQAQPREQYRLTEADSRRATMETWVRAVSIFGLIPGAIGFIIGYWRG